MTNTRITDAEVFERRYPVLLREFSLRAGSGGAGKYRGGDGVVRDIEFRVPVQASILSERRVYRPYGLEGGEDAKCGLNIWVRKVETRDSVKSDRKLAGSEEGEGDAVYEERRINLGGKNTAAMKAGERIIIHTPGGGGWGRVGEKKEAKGETRDGNPKYGWKGGSFASREETALQA
jgi:5-oxoprolinase (ATP-hydrolysing)